MKQLIKTILKLYLLSAIISCSGIDYSNPYSDGAYLRGSQANTSLSTSDGGLDVLVGIDSSMTRTQAVASFCGSPDADADTYDIWWEGNADLWNVFVSIDGRTIRDFGKRTVLSFCADGKSHEIRVWAASRITGDMNTVNVNIGRDVLQVRIHRTETVTLSLELSVDAKKTTLSMGENSDVDYGSRSGYYEGLVYYTARVSSDRKVPGAVTVICSPALGNDLNPALTKYTDGKYPLYNLTYEPWLNGRTGDSSLAIDSGGSSSPVKYCTLNAASYLKDGFSSWKTFWEDSKPVIGSAYFDGSGKDGRMVTSSGLVYVLDWKE